jgi:hypothetical protein
MQLFPYLSPNSVTRETITSNQYGHPSLYVRLSDDGAGGSGLVLPGGRENTDGLVVTSQAVNSGLDKNEAELGVLVLAVTLKVLSDGDSLFIC